MEILLQAMHIVPLFLIIGLVGLNAFKTVKNLFSFVLVLCSVGVLAGNAVHHGEIIHLFDPCLGYAAALVAMAVKLSKVKLAVEKISK